MTTENQLLMRAGVGGVEGVGQVVCIGTIYARTRNLDGSGVSDSRKFLYKLHFVKNPRLPFLDICAGILRAEAPWVWQRGSY